MVTVVIPAYEMHGRGVEFLTDAIKSCYDHGLDDILVSDDSTSMDIKRACELLGARHVFNSRKKGTSGNLNNAIQNAQGDIIKILFQDDRIWGAYDYDRIRKWAVCKSIHENRIPHIPYHPKDLKELAIGGNTYGSPSAVCFRKGVELFDEQLKWLLDCDWYVKMIKKYGLPDLIWPEVMIREWDGQATYTEATGSVRLHEYNKMMERYADL